MWPPRLEPCSLSHGFHSTLHTYILAITGFNNLFFTANIGPKSDGGKSKAYGSGKETLRFRNNAPAKIETSVSKRSPIVR